MSITTSYFGILDSTKGTKISIARYTLPQFRNKVDEIQLSFAPSKDLLKSYQDNKIDWRGYKTKYIEEQRAHFINSPENFQRLLERAVNEEIILVCYEKFERTKTRCHRILLYDILKNVAEKKKINVNFIDEEN